LQKAEILAGLVAKFKEAKSIGFAATSTLTVEEFSNLRAGLREVDATYTLAKKTLMKKALKEALDIDVDLSTLPGQIGAVCSNEDAVAGLGKVNDLVKSSKGEKIEWAAAIFEGKLIDLEETKVIAGLPSKDTLLGRLVGSMKSPISGLARFFDAAAKDVESKGKTTVAELTVEAPAAESKTEEAPKEEVKTEEAPKAENTEAPAKEEAKTEEK
jgi:large subunit ribosomal protein L10